ncbi:formate dehydrogenase accessory protein FdhE [Pantoea ananatis]
MSICMKSSSLGKNTFHPQGRDLDCYDQPVGNIDEILKCCNLLTDDESCHDGDNRNRKNVKPATKPPSEWPEPRLKTYSCWCRESRNQPTKQENALYEHPHYPARSVGEERKKPSGDNPAVTFPQLKRLYSRRAARLRDLAAKNPLGDYLRFAAVIAQAQEIVLYDHPLQMNLHARLVQSAQEGKPPLDIHTLPRDTHWHRLLHSLIAELKPEMSGQALAVLENLEKASASELETMASALFAGEYAQVSSDKAPFIWASLSIYWAQMAALIPGKAQAEMGNQRQYCPVCNSMPVASMVHMGTDEGARYLHCNLCESEWYVVRSKCTNCEQSRDLHYWSLDSEHAAVKAESCGDCGSYLKILYQQKNPAIEPVADDLASLVLDARMEQEGFTRSSLNPFMFPGE